MYGGGKNQTEKAQTVKVLTGIEQLMEKKPKKPRTCYCLGSQCFLSFEERSRSEVQEKYFSKV